MIFPVTKENFQEEVLNAKQPVMVDFSAEWCGPCKMIEPIIDEISTEYFGKVKVCKVDTDKDIELCAQYKILSIPAVLLFKNGQVDKTLSGYAEKEDILSLFEIE